VIDNLFWSLHGDKYLYCNRNLRHFRVSLLLVAAHMVGSGRQVARSTGVVPHRRWTRLAVQSPVAKRPDILCVSSLLVCRVDVLTGINYDL
jgi:hypothetical protein